jgi:hypothetical protein
MAISGVHHFLTSLIKQKNTAQEAGGIVTKQWFDLGFKLTNLLLKSEG